MGRIEPISFSEVEESAYKEIPDDVIETINKLLQTNYNANKKESELTIDEIVNKYFGPLETWQVRDQLFRWDIEGLYGNYGWDVSFHTPDRGEAYNSYYLFSKK